MEIDKPLHEWTTGELEFAFMEATLQYVEHTKKVAELDILKNKLRFSLGARYAIDGSWFGTYFQCQACGKDSFFGHMREKDGRGVFRFHDLCHTLSVTYHIRQYYKEREDDKIEDLNREGILPYLKYRHPDFDVHELVLILQNYAEFQMEPYPVPLSQPVAMETEGVVG